MFLAFLHVVSVYFWGVYSVNWLWMNSGLLVMLVSVLIVYVD